MKILISNDDGIHAQGIKTLYHTIQDMADIDVVAPDSERSAVGHGITLQDPIKMREEQLNGDFFGYAISGTPADCVKLATCALLPQPPDFVISGINLGPNAGIAVIYSGTVSAATEGTILGIPSMALSLNTFTNPQWDTAAHVSRIMTHKMMKTSLPEDVLLNVNIPNVPISDLQGYRVTRMAKSHYVERFDERVDPRGNHYYWLDGDLIQTDAPEGTDLEALEAGYVSITPIGLDLTRYDAMDALKGWEESNS